MLKRCGRRLLLALAGALLACLLVLTADPPPPPGPAERGRRALRSLAGPAGAAPARGLVAEAAPGALAREVHSLSEYFGLLTRARRDAGPPPAGAFRPAAGPPRPPAEPLAPHDVFIAVKTTKKFHRARLDLLLETWISRHKDMVSRRGPGGRSGRGPGPGLVQRVAVSDGRQAASLSRPGEDGLVVTPVYPLPAQFAGGAPVCIPSWKCWSGTHPQRHGGMRGPYTSRRSCVFVPRDASCPLNAGAQ